MPSYAVIAAAALALAAAPPAMANVNSVGYATAESGQTGAVRTATAECDPGRRLVGGGGGITSYHGDSRVVITEMIPVHPLTGPDRYIVSAQGPADDHWTIEAQAVCADPVSGTHTVLAATTLSSASVQQAEPRCKSGERVLGTGGWVVQPTAQQVALQAVGPDASGQFGYAQAHEDANGYGGQWNVLAYAVCAPKPSRYAVVTHDAPAFDSQPFKASGTDCPDDDMRILGAGGGTAFDAPGNAALNRLQINTDQRSSDATAVELDPTDDWWRAAGESICG